MHRLYDIRSLVLYLYVYVQVQVSMRSTWWWWCGGGGDGGGLTGGGGVPGVQECSPVTRPVCRTIHLLCPYKCRGCEIYVHDQLKKLRTV